METEEETKAKCQRSGEASPEERLQDDKWKEYLGRISSKRRWREGEKGVERPTVLGAGMRQ